MAGLVAVGFEALDSAAVGLAAVSFNQHQVHHPDAAEPTSVTKITDHNAAKPDVGKLQVYPCSSSRCNNQPIQRNNIIRL